MQPYTPHGDSNQPAENPRRGSWMQPYTPHGDSNGSAGFPFSALVRCNLIPLTGTVTGLLLVQRLPTSGCNLIPLTGTVTLLRRRFWIHR